MHLYILFNWCIQKKNVYLQNSLAGNVKLLKTIREFLTNYYIMKRSIFILISLLCSLLYRTETLAQSKFSDYCLYKDTMDVDLYCINVFSLEEYNVQERNFGIL